MKNIRKKISKNLKMLIIIVIVILGSSGVGVWASYNLTAKNVVYTMDNGEEINVQDALSEIYDSSTGFVGYFNQVYTSIDRNERPIQIVDHNDKFAEVDGNTLKITKPGKYTVYCSVTHSPQSCSMTTNGRLRLNGNDVLCPWQNYIDTSATVTHSFTVSKDSNINVTFSIFSDGSFSNGTIASTGSAIVIKNK